MGGTLWTMQPWSFNHGIRYGCPSNIQQTTIPLSRPSPLSPISPHCWHCCYLPSPVRPHWTIPNIRPLSLARMLPPHTSRPSLRQSRYLIFVYLQWRRYVLADCDGRSGKSVLFSPPRPNFMNSMHHSHLQQKDLSRAKMFSPSSITFSCFLLIGSNDGIFVHWKPEPR